MNTQRKAQVTSASHLRTLAVAVMLAFAPSLTGYLYLQPFRQVLIGIGMSDVLAYYLSLLLTHLTTMLWLAFWLRFEMQPYQWRRIAQYLTLNRVDWRGLLYVLPLSLVVFAIIAASLKWRGVSPTIPSYDAAEASGPAGSVLAVAILLTTLFAEEGYYRVFLMKKLAPLGKLDWIVAGVLFGLYHWYALPLQFLLTTPLPLGLLAAFVFKQRQNIYPVILLHALAIVAGNAAAVIVLS